MHAFAIPKWCVCDKLFVFSPRRQNKRRTFYIDPRCHPQTIAVVQTRAKYVFASNRPTYECYVKKSVGLTRKRKRYIIVFQYFLVPLISLFHRRVAATSGWRRCWSFLMRWTSPGKMWAGCSSSTQTPTARWKISRPSWTGPTREGWGRFDRGTKVKAQNEPCSRATASLWLLCIKRIWIRFSTLNVFALFTAALI